MFDKKNDLVFSAMTSFKNNNNSGYMPDFYAMYMTLIESRIANDLLLIRDPELCISLGLDTQTLYAELRNLVAIRQEVSFDPVDKKVNERDRRHK